MSRTISYNEPRIPISFNEFQNDLNIFASRFDSIRHKQSQEVQLGFLEKFSTSYPLALAQIFNVYLTSANIYGDMKLSKEAARIYVEMTRELSKIGQAHYRLPLIVQDVNFVLRYGELFDQAAITKVQVQLGSLLSQPVLALPPTLLAKMNSAVLPYLEDAFEVVVKKPEVEYFQRNTNYCPYTSFFFKYSDSQYGHNGDFFGECAPDLIKANTGSATFSLKEITITKALKFLKNFGIKKEDEFVLLHLRESGFADGQQHTFRNANPKKYLAAINHFLDQGLKVVRIGHPNMTPMFQKPGFIDLTKVDRPGEVDIFLCGQAKFYFGCYSGPASTANTFGVPVCLTALRPGGIRLNTFVQFLKLKDEVTKKILTFDDLDDRNLKLIIAEQPLRDKCLTPIFPTSEDNLKFAKEVLDYFENGNMFQLNEAYKYHRHKHKIFGGVSTDSMSLLL